MLNVWRSFALTGALINLLQVITHLMWAFSLFVVVEAELAPPQDLDMITMNTRYILSWNWDQSTAGGHPVTFTAQYLA